MKVNGSLVFDASSASEIQNLRVQKFQGAFVPAWTSADMGRAIYVTDTGGGYNANTLYIGGATDWVAIATGGNAAALQSEVDAIETTLGAAITASGTYNAAAFVGGAFSSPTSFTDAINQLAAYANANNTLAELDDVALVVPADNDLLQFNGTEWTDVAIGSESGVQAYDAGLDALAAFDTNGIIVQTATNTYAGRQLVQPAAGVSISNADGVAGNPTFALANDLAAVEGLAGTGYAVRTGADTWTNRSIAGTSGRIVVSDGDGVATDTNVDLATVTNPGNGGTFVKITTDTYGRVTNSTAVLTSDITALVDAVYVNISGDTMDTGANLTFSGGGTVKGVPAPSLDTDVANKAYVDALTAGLSWKQAVRAASTANIADLSTTTVVDGVTLASGDRVLVKNQSSAAQNGVYTFNGTGLVRSSDMDAAAEFAGATVFVTEGTANSDSGWTQTAEVTTVGTDAVNWAQFSGSSTYTWGVGLASTGNTININVGAGIAELPTDEVGIDLYDSSNSALILTSDGSTRTTTSPSQLYLLLDGAGALAQTSSGLKINAASVTNAMLVNDGVTLNADSGTGTLDLGQTLLVQGSSVQGIATTASGQTITVAGIDASTTQKGVASFDTSHFSVAAGAVSLQASIDDLTNVTGADAAATDSLLTKDSGGDWVPVTRAAVAGSVNLADIGDVGTASPTAGHVLAGNGTTWNNQKVYHLHTQGSAATTWTVTHNIGQQYCNVTVVDSTDEVVIPMSITFDSTTALTVTFNTAITGKVVVMGLA